MLWLERKYLSMVMSNLDRAKWVNENTLNHRCPYCGDSQRNVYKARGYHFVKEQSFIFKCHNCSKTCLLYTSPSPRDNRVSRMPSSA